MVDEIFKIQNLTKRYLNVPQFKSEPNPMLGDDLRVSEGPIFFLHNFFSPSRGMTSTFNQFESKPGKRRSVFENFQNFQKISKNKTFSKNKTIVHFLVTFMYFQFPKVLRGHTRFPG